MTFYRSVVDSNGGVALVPDPPSSGGGGIFAPQLIGSGGIPLGPEVIPPNVTQDVAGGAAVIVTGVAGDQVLVMWQINLALVGITAGGQGLVEFELLMDGLSLPGLNVQSWFGCVPDPVSTPAGQSTVCMLLNVELPDAAPHAFSIVCTTSDANAGIGLFGNVGTFNVWRMQP